MESQEEEKTTVAPPLKIIEDMLYNNIITQKKEELHNYLNRASTDSLWIRIETLQ